MREQLSDSMYEFTSCWLSNITVPLSGPCTLEPADFLRHKPNRASIDMINDPLSCVKQIHACSQSSTIITQAHSYTSFLTLGHAGQESSIETGNILSS